MENQLHARNLPNFGGMFKNLLFDFLFLQTGSARARVLSQSRRHRPACWGNHLTQLRGSMYLYSVFRAIARFAQIAKTKMGIKSGLPIPGLCLFNLKAAVPWLWVLHREIKDSSYLISKIHANSWCPESMHSGAAPGLGPQNCVAERKDRAKVLGSSTHHPWPGERQ